MVPSQICVCCAMTGTPSKNFLDKDIDSLRISASMSGKLGILQTNPFTEDIKLDEIFKKSFLKFQRGLKKKKRKLQRINRLVKNYKIKI